eukprot:jgi/Hompol1/2655/HPOL_002999-RA
MQPMNDTGLRKRTLASMAAAAPSSLAATSDQSTVLPLLEESKIHPLISPGVPKMPSGSTIVAVLITLVALWTRIYKINQSPYVVWDEAHFGKFAGYYIKRTFYFDVHPPLGKMLNGFAGLLAGFNGTFEFESGARYPSELSYGVMRFFNALFGAFIAPLAYYTGIHLHMSQAGAILLATLVIVDNAICTISRFILLDSMLLFFTALSVYSLTVFRNYQKTDPFSFEWYLWLFMTGISLGLVSSVKWVGLFAIALIGLHTIEDLWEMLGDLYMPPKVYINHWVARIFGLIVMPISVYVLSFVMHFAILNRSGPGDAQMSSVFQAHLAGNDFNQNPLELAYGSKITIKNNARGGGLLHSHVQRYPSGSEQQQVTCYHHKDNNNEFIVMKPWGVDSDLANDPVQFVESGDVIRLVHDQTKKNIHGHNVPGPITTTANEVSGYGNETFGDSNDHWIIERVDDWSNAKGSLPPGGKNAYKGSFIRDFFDLNVAMWSSNNALTPDQDKEPDQLVSQPYHWPLMLRGLRMCGWSDSDIKYYLLGNPFIWWSSTACIVLLPILFLVYTIRWRRGLRDFATLDEWDNFFMATKIGVVGWFLHYMPFYIMGRVM